MPTGIKTTDYARRIKRAERLLFEAILVIVASLVIGYYLGVIIP
jgi:hypothetical protein